MLRQLPTRPFGRPAGNALSSQGVPVRENLPITQRAYDYPDNATPICRNDRVIGHMLVRTKPKRDEVAGAERLYRRFRQGQARGLACCKGIGVRAAASDYWMRWQVSEPIKLSLKQARAVASGWDSESPALNRRDEIGMLLRAVNQSGLNLRSLVADVRGQTDGLHTAGSEIANGNADLSLRTELQASSRRIVDIVSMIDGIAFQTNIRRP